MAIRNVKLGGTDFVAHEKLKALDVNDTFNAASMVIDQIYTGTGFDVSASNSSGSTGTTTTDTATTTLEVGGGEIFNYVRIVITIATSASGTSNNTINAYSTLKIETAEHGSSFTERFNQTMHSASYYTESHAIVHTIEFAYQPTAGEKLNGLDIRLTGDASAYKYSSSGSCSTSMTNVQTVIWRS